MNRSHLFAIAIGLTVLPLVLCCGCGEGREIVLTPQGTFTVSHLQGREVGRQYAEHDLPDYAVVWSLSEIRTNLRGDFLDGFVEGLAGTSAAESAASCRKVLQDALSGNQFETAKDLGAKHAAKAATNEQVQGTIHSSLGVSRGVALGWKAGYIKGFASQRIADSAAAAAIKESRIGQMHIEAAAMYHALRAAIEP